MGRNLPQTAPRALRGSSAVHSIDDGRAEFSVRTGEHSGVRVIDVRGELDLSTVAVLQPELETAIQARGPVVVDLCATTFMDSQGLYSLLVLSERLREQGRPMAIACWPDGAVAVAFRVSGTGGRLLTLRSSRAAAIQAVTAPAPDDSPREDPADPPPGLAETVLRAGEAVVRQAARTLRSLARF
jgi:anti-anti-sigma factor